MAKKTSKSGKTKKLSGKSTSSIGQGAAKPARQHTRRLFIFGSGILAIALAIVLFLIFGIDRQIVLAVPGNEIAAWTKVLDTLADSYKGKSTQPYSVRLVSYESVAKIPSSTLVERPLRRADTASVPLFPGNDPAKDAAISRLLPGLRGIVEGPKLAVLPIAVDPWLLFYRRDLGIYKSENSEIALSTQSGAKALPAANHTLADRPSAKTGLVIFSPFWKDFARVSHPISLGKQRVVPLVIPGRDDGILWIETLAAYPEIGTSDAAIRDLDAKAKAGLVQNNWRNWNLEDVLAELSARRGAATVMSLGAFYHMDPVESVVFEAAPFPGSATGGLRIVPARLTVIVRNPEGGERPGQAAFLQDLLGPVAQRVLADSLLRLGAAEGLPPRDAAGQAAIRVLSGPARIVLAP